MKKNEGLHQDVHNAIKEELLLITAETGISLKIAKNLKKFIILGSLAGIVLFFNSCVGGYIATEPSYAVVSARPPQPTNVHVWIDGDWKWNRQTNGYVQRTGYWEKPRQGQTYTSGHWQASPRGKYWVAGRWQKQNRNHKHDSR